jgi:hypothetical protein
VLELHRSLDTVAATLYTVSHESLAPAVAHRAAKPSKAPLRTAWSLAE